MKYLLQPPKCTTAIQDLYKRKVLLFRTEFGANATSYHRLLTISISELDVTHILIETTTCQYLVPLYLP